MLASSTPDALWGAPQLRLLRPAGVSWTDLRRGSLLRDCSLTVPVGTRLLVYLFFRQLTSALGLTSIAGQAQCIRPIVAPMAEGAVEVRMGELDADTRQAVRAQAAATDNVGLFFGEDIFIAIGSILLMVGFLAQSGITLDPIQLSVWAIPTAIVAFLIHGVRLVLFDRRMARRTAA